MTSLGDRCTDLVSVALFCYNQAAYVAEAVQSVLAQDYSPLEVILSDDASTDGSAVIIRALAAAYRGPHRVIVNINSRNLGVSAHCNRITDMASGRLVVAAAADDVSLPHRVRAIHEAWVRGGRLSQSFYSACILMRRDGSGNEISIIREHDRFSDRPFVARHGGWVLGATEAWTKDLFSHFGPLDSRLTAEDHAIHFRAAMLDGVTYVPEALVRYREGIGSWRSVPAAIRGVRARQKRFRQGWNMELQNARQALDDLLLLGDSELIGLGQTRLRCAEVMADLANRTPFSPVGVYKALRTGVNAKRVFVGEFRRGVPYAEGCLGWVSRIRKGG